MNSHVNSRTGSVALRGPIRSMALVILAFVVAGCQAKTPAVSPGQHSATLAWTASNSKDVQGYRVYRTTDPNASPGLLAVTPAGTTRYVDTTVEAGRTYYYSVKAFDAAGKESVFSEKISATIPTK
jgi:fibronectin type 3 domain-containing protein